MNRLPLQLERYFFTRLNVEANAEYGVAETKRADADVTMDVQLQVAKKEDDPSFCQLSLGLSNFNVKEGRLPYSLDLEVVGFFRIDPEFKHNDRERIVQVNGASMLYGSAREHLLMVTGRGPWGAFQLPTINFFGVMNGASE